MIFLEPEGPSSIFKDYFRKGYFLRGSLKIQGLHGKDFLVENHDIKEYFFRDSWIDNEDCKEIWSINQKILLMENNELLQHIMAILFLFFPKTCA